MKRQAELSKQNYFSEYRHTHTSPLSVQFIDSRYNPNQHQQQTYNKHIYINNQEQQAISSLRNQLTNIKTDINKLIDHGSSTSNSDIRSPAKIINYELREIHKLNSVINIPREMKPPIERKPQSPNGYENGRGLQFQFGSNSQQGNGTRVNFGMNSPQTPYRDHFAKTAPESDSKFKIRLSFNENKNQVSQIVRQISFQEKISQLENTLKEKELHQCKLERKITLMETKQKQLIMELEKVNCQLINTRFELSKEKDIVLMKQSLLQIYINERNEKNQQHQTLAKNLAQQTQKVHEYQFQSRQAQQIKEKLQKRVKTLQDENNDFRKRVDSYKKSLQQMNCSNNSTRQKQIVLKEDNRILQEQLKYLQEELKQKQKLITSLYNDVKILDGEIRRYAHSKARQLIFEKHIHELNQTIMTFSMSQASKKYETLNA